MEFEVMKRTKGVVTLFKPIILLSQGEMKTTYFIVLLQRMFFLSLSHFATTFVTASSFMLIVSKQCTAIVCTRGR